MKHYPLILLFIFTSRGLISDHCSKDEYKLRLQMPETMK